MSSFLKKIFGIGTDDDDEIFVDDPGLAHPEAIKPSPALSGTAPDSLPQTDPADVASAIFDNVVAVINASLPDFLASTVDTDKQRRYLFDALNQDTRRYLADLEAKANAVCEARWAAQSEKLLAEMEQMKQRAKDLENKRSEMKERQLSADRQKRALSDRVHDLEAQILKSEADREQLELENKSLINKAKVVNVYEKEIEELQQQITALRGGAPVQPDHDVLAEKEAQIDQLRQELTQKDTLLAEKDTAIAGLEASLSECRGQIASLTDKVEHLQAEVDSAADSEQIRTITEQLERFTEVRAMLDAKITRLTQSLAESKKEAESLRFTMKNNLMQHARQEKALRQEIDALKAGLPAADTAKKSRRRVVEDTSDVQDVISDTDWLVSIPPKGSSMRVSEASDTDFGYQAPPKKPKQPHNDAQLNLFD